MDAICLSQASGLKESALAWRPPREATLRFPPDSAASSALPCALIRDSQGGQRGPPVHPRHSEAREGHSLQGRPAAPGTSARTRFKAERDVLNRTQTAPSVKGKNGPTGPRGSQGLVLRRDRCRRVGPRGGCFCNVSPRAGERPRTPSPLKRGEADGLKIGQTPEPALRGRRVRVPRARNESPMP